jgi:hypothetical protein
MKLLLPVAALALAVSTGPAFALRCGTDLVIEGQTKFDVLLRCGAPSFTDGRLEYRPGGPNPTIPRPIESLGQTYPFASGRETQVEEWVYNFGPTQLMSVLIFENGRLIEIRTLGYGR